MALKEESKPKAKPTKRPGAKADEYFARKLKQANEIIARVGTPEAPVRKAEEGKKAA